MHSDLADAFGVVRSPASCAARADAMHARLDDAITVVPRLSRWPTGLRATYDALADAASQVSLQRIHGDLHLGQVLRTVAPAG